MNPSLIATLQAFIRPVKSRLSQMIARGKLEQIQDDPSFQKAQVSFSTEDVQNNIERIQNFGFTSVPPENSEVLALFLGGQKDFPLLIACDHREKRLKALEQGESAMYNAENSKLVLKKNGKVTLDNGTYELISVLVELAEQVAAIHVPPQAGGPILNRMAVELIKTKLESFKS